MTDRPTPVADLHVEAGLTDAELDEFIRQNDAKLDKLREHLNLYDAVRDETKPE